MLDPAHYVAGCVKITSSSAFGISFVDQLVLFVFAGTRTYWNQFPNVLRKACVEGRHDCEQ